MGERRSSTRRSPAGRSASPAFCSRYGSGWSPSSARRTPTIRCPGVFYVLLWVGLVAVSLVFGPVWRVLSPVRTVHRLLGGKSLRSYPEALGYWPAALGLFAFVWLELASPDPGSLAAIRIWLLIYLAVTLAGALVCGDALVRPRRPVRGVQHGGVAVVGAAAQPRRPHRDRQPVRPSAVAAGAAGHRRGAVGAAGVDGIRQLLRRPQWRTFIDETAGSAATATLINTCGAAGLRGGGRGHVLAGREGDRRSRPRTAPRTAGADGAFAHPDRRGLCVRALPDLSDRAGPADRLSC